MCFMDIESLPNLKLFQCLVLERSISYIQSQRRDLVNLSTMLLVPTIVDPPFFGKSPNSALKFEWFNTNIVWILKNVELILGHD